MMKKLLKTSYVILMVMIITTGMISIPVKAAESASVIVGSGTALVGEEVSVTINVSGGGSNIIMCDLWISYDSKILEALPGYTSNADGNIRILEDMNAKTASFTLKFKALTKGSSNISITSSSIITSMMEDRVTINASTGKVTVNVPSADTPAPAPGGTTYSSNNNLSSLQISPGTISPAFSPNVTSYTATVGSDCTALTVSAPTEDSTAKVSVTGKTMDPGTNTTKIIVKAQNGSTKTYVITTNKVAGATPTQAVDNAVVATQAQTTPAVVAAITTTINGASYNVISDFTNHPLPTGYTATAFDFNGQSVTAGKGANNLTIMYLEKADGSGTGNFYVYDTASKTFSLLSTITQPALTYTILPITSSMEIPNNYTKSTLTINGNSVDILIPNGSDVKYCLFYGVDSAGTSGWYRFDYTEQTVQKYYGEDLSSAVVASSNVAAQGGNVNLWKIIAASSALAAILFLIIMIVLVFKLRSNRSDHDYDDADEDGQDIFSAITYNELHNNDDDDDDHHDDSINDNSSDEDLDVNKSNSNESNANKSENKEDHNSEIASEIGADAEAAATMNIEFEDDDLDTENVFENDDFRVDTEELFDDNDQNNDISDMKDILEDDDDIDITKNDDDDDFEFLDIEDLEDK
ncbi:cadherin-like beta sandwich domain-containing protein [[Clostridium] fimetarium]|uniref:Cohesin domain-containing protein n=1 Tax=[Clostridium] fimetarium TaxID=99656 RepID=A0A1I0R2W6_9FIRM|nr:cadherin-like beta sandwich domain-containing protein [[Clostridium] fimetarium]SEW34610.1 Cohesin domain-containing protein [[Clostridium] fimetarium]